MFRSEFRNTHFSYTLGEGGVERFVATPELRTDDAIDPDPLPPGQIWGMSPSGQEAGASLYRIEATAGPGSGGCVVEGAVGLGGLRVHSRLRQLAKHSIVQYRSENQDIGHLRQGNCMWT